jgi:hypothetical protein
MEAASPPGAVLAQVGAKVPDFIGTMGSSDSSKVCDRGFRILPSRGCLPAAMSRDEAPSRSPGSRTDGMCERAELSDSGRADATRSTLSVAPVLSSTRGSVSTSPPDFFRSSITRPARAASYASRTASPPRTQGLAFPAVDSCRGRI